MVPGVPGPCRGSLLIILSEALWLKQSVLFMVSPTICKGNHLLDICTWARVPLGGCEGVLPFVRGLGCHLSGAHPGWWQVQGMRTVTLIPGGPPWVAASWVCSCIHLSCLHVDPGLIKRKEESFPLLLDREAPERKRWAPTRGQLGAGSELGLWG